MKSRNKPPSKVDIVREFLDTQPEDIPNRTAARVLRKKRPDVFSSIEAARDSVRAVRGAHSGGVTATHKRRGRKAGEGSNWSLPKQSSSAPKKKHFKGKEKWLVVSDAHIPAHDERALMSALDHGAEEDCTAIYINGDFADNYAFSRWFRRPSDVDTVRDVGAVREVLRQIADHFPRRVYKMGNHEKRYEEYIAKRAPELFELPQIQLSSLIGIEEFEYDKVAENQIGMIGKLPILHGHELSRGFAPPVNPARGAWLKAGDSVIISHHHKTSTHVETSGIEMNTVATWSLGCLCSLNPDYSPVTKWNHGWGIIEVDGVGGYEVSNYLLLRKGKIVRA